MRNLIEVQNLKKSFTTDAGELQVLKGIDLSIKAGEMVGIVGASGVGKSTLLHILGALDKPTSGKVLYDEADIFSLNENSLAFFRNKTIGFVFQFHHLLPEFNALENTLMPRLIARTNKKEAMELAKEMLVKVGLGDRMHHRIGELSGGEQQRVAIARALINDPDIIIADEPTSNIDAESVQKLLNILDVLKKEGKTIIVSSHDPIFNDYGDVTFHLVNGHVADVRKKE